MITYRIRVVAERSIDVVLENRDDDLAHRIALDEAILEHAEAYIERVIETSPDEDKQQRNEGIISSSPGFNIAVEVADDEDQDVALGIPEQLCTNCDGTCDPVYLTCPTCGSYNLRSL